MVCLFKTFSTRVFQAKNCSIIEMKCMYILNQVYVYIKYTEITKNNITVY